ncbi:hypothetical protein ACFV4M_25825 [Kitasatospora indigofera]|uniref:hypothetical protein n=1 Tax=Kitasatospora indigofera TaxID=67307 RepID=UPI00364C7F2A
MWLAGVLGPLQCARVVWWLAEPDRLHPAIAGDNTEPEMQAGMARAREGGPPILIPDYQKAPPRGRPDPALRSGLAEALVLVVPLVGRRLTRLWDQPGLSPREIAWLFVSGVV